MRAIMIMVAVLVSTAFLGSFAVCNAGEVSRSKKNKIEKYLVKYGTETAEQMYKKACERSSVSGSPTFDKFNSKIKTIQIKSINTENVLGSKYHFVKCKIDYQLSRKDKDYSYNYARYMAVVIVEDGFGKMGIDQYQSKEVSMLDIRIPASADLVAAGEELLK